MKLLSPAALLFLPILTAVTFGWMGGCSKEPPPSSAGGQGARPVAQPGGSAPASAPSATAGSQPAASTAPFIGEVRLDASVPKDAVKETDVLFIMARESLGGGQAGRLLATQRHAPVALPLKFEMSSKDLMVPGMPFSGPFIVNARLDRDGDPMSKGDDDLYATITGEVSGGQAQVDLVLKPGAPKPAEAPGSPPIPSGAPQSQPANHP